MQRQCGFTLIEAVIALAVVAVCLGMAIPTVTGTVSATHAAAAKAAMVEAFSTSLRHSAVTGVEVVLCPADRGVCVDSVDWSEGWIAFADLDGDRRPGPAESLLLQQAALTSRVHLRSTSGRTHLVFQPQGGAAAGSNVTFTLCDARGPAKATTLVLANSGQYRQDQADPAAAAACMQPL